MIKSIFKICLLSLAFVAAACAEAEMGEVSSEKAIAFNLATIQSMDTKAISGESRMIIPSESDVRIALVHETSDMVPSMMDCEQTRATTRYDSETEFRSQEFSLWGWNVSDAGTKIYTKETVAHNGTVWAPATQKPWITGSTYSFVAFYPTATSDSEITLTVPDDTREEGVTFTYNHLSNSTGASYDYMLAYFKGAKANDTNPTLTFTHPFTCVKFQSSGSAVINSIKVEDLYKSGSCSVIKNSSESGDYYTYSWTAGEEKHYINCNVGDEFITIPQNLATANVKLTVNISIDGYTFNSYVTLDSENWEAGKVNTYTFTTNQDVSVGVTDVVSGKEKTGVQIQNTGASKAYIRATIVGGWYDDEGVMTAEWDPESGTFTGLPGSDWVKCDADGYYYYKNPVAGGAYTGSVLFTKYEAPAEAAARKSHLELAILVEAVIWDKDKVRVTVAWPEAVSILD